MSCASSRLLLHMPILAGVEKPLAFCRDRTRARAEATGNDGSACVLTGIVQINKDMYAAAYLCCAECRRMIGTAPNNVFSPSFMRLSVPVLSAEFFSDAPGDSRRAAFDYVIFYSRAALAVFVQLLQIAGRRRIFRISPDRLLNG